MAPGGGSGCPHRIRHGPYNRNVLNGNGGDEDSAFSGCIHHLLASFGQVDRRCRTAGHRHALSRDSRNFSGKAGPVPCQTGQFMADTFKNHTQNLTAPPSAAAEITPSDTAELSFATRAIYVGTAGNLRLRMLDGSTVTLTNLQSGAMYALRSDRIMATGTTAGGLVGLW
jgi:hypothetical protein